MQVELLRVFLLFCLAVACKASTMRFRSEIPSFPRQIHIAYDAVPSAMSVTWSTVTQVSKPGALYHPTSGGRSQIAFATSKLFVDGNNATHQRWIHKSVMTLLKPGVNYTYSVGAVLAPFSPKYTFVSMRTDPQYSPRFAVYGDLGLKNPQSVSRLLQDMHANRFDAVLHVGDFAYDLATNDSTVGEAFMELMEPIAARLPYMTCPGNHEYHYNFSNYKAIFQMPGNADSMFYSFNMGPVHFVSISTEFYFYIEYGISQIAVQYQWLINDLQNANKPENRAKQPWIILYGHRPIYCSNNNSDCGWQATWLRNGIPVIHYYGLEDALAKYGVDLAIWGHEHSYERLWPIMNGEVRNGSTPGKPYVDPQGIVHVITGSAGCQERHDYFGMRKPLTAFRSEDYGYSRMQVINGTHLYFEQVSDDQNGKVIDHFTLVRNSHGPFA